MHLKQLSQPDAFFHLLTCKNEALENKYYAIFVVVILR